MQYRGIEISGTHPPDVETQQFIVARLLYLAQDHPDKHEPQCEWYSLTWLGFGESVDCDQPGAVAVARTIDSGGSDYLYFWVHIDSDDEHYLAERWSTQADDEDVAHFVLSEEGEDTVLTADIADYVPYLQAP